MFDRILIESASQKKSKDQAVSALVSATLHVLVVGVILFAVVSKAAPEVVQAPIRAFMVGNNPAPPPPPPPPPPGDSAGGPVARTPEPEEPEPTPLEDTFVAPIEVPLETPRATLPMPDDAIADGGLASGVEGGVEGGVVGGVVGGVIGGVIGGTLGGTLGGTVGGTGTGTGPLRPGGDVMPPVVVRRVEPEYTEAARKERLQGIVIIEAVIDTEGNVTQARILKGLAGGLGDSALKAVRQWKFKPGTLDGTPVPVIFDLMVRFRLQ